MSSRSRQQLEAWLKGIAVSGKVLDIGGSQNPAKGRTGSWAEDTICLVFDLEQPHETKKAPDVTGDIQWPMTERLQEHDFKFDIVFCLEVAEYWYDPAQAMRNIGAFLNKGGHAYVSFHTLYGLHNPEGEDCLRYTYNAIEKLAKQAGLEIEDCTVKEISPDGKNRLEAFYLTEKMRLRFNDPATYDEGYLVTFKKK